MRNKVLWYTLADNLSLDSLRYTIVLSIFVLFREFAYWDALHRPFRWWRANNRQTYCNTATTNVHSLLPKLFNNKTNVLQHGNQGFSQLIANSCKKVNPDQAFPLFFLYDNSS